MSSSFVWMIIGMGIVSYLTRFPALWLGVNKGLSGRWVRAFMLAPLGIFTALAIPPLFIPQPDVPWDFSYIGGGAVAAFIAWKTKHPLWAMIGGVATVALYRWVFTQ